METAMSSVSEKEAQLDGMTDVATPGTVQKGPGRLTKDYWVRAVKTIIFFGVLIWIPACWLLGSAHNQKNYVKNMHVLIADMDQSGIGKTVAGTCAAVSGHPGMPSFDYHTDVSSFEEAYHRVWNGKFWGSITIHANATKNFVNAFMTGDKTYDPKSAITLVWNSARWPATTYGYINPILTAMITASQPVFKEKFGQALLKQANGTITPDMYEVFFNAYGSTTEDIHRFDSGARYFLGTGAIVFPTIFPFFVALGLRAACDEFGILRKLDAVVYKAGSGALLTFLCSLFYATWVYIFHEDVAFSGKDFILIWLVFWLYGYACFWFFDTVANAVPPAFIPAITLSFVVIQVSAAAFPNVIMNKFYRIHYIMPSFNAFELFITVVTRGSTSHVKRNMPALIGWALFWFCCDFLAQQRYAKNRLKKEQQESESLGSEVTVGK